MFTIINSLAFTTFLVFVVVQALRSMREFRPCQDRTGLRTTHPELLDEHGNITKEELAGKLYDSLRNKIMSLPDNITIYPAHGAGSACGKNMMSITYDTLFNQKKSKLCT